MTEEHPSRFALERFHAAVPAPDVEQHVAGCERCARRLAALDADDRAFLSRYPQPPQVAQPGRGWRAAVGLALAAGLCAVIYAGTTMGPPFPQERAKGSAGVELLLRRGEATDALAGRPVHAGDTLLFRPQGEARYLLVVGVEASGRVQKLLADGDQSLPVTPGKIPPIGVRLDDYPGTERWIAITSSSPLTAGVAVEKLRARFLALSDDARGTLEVGLLNLGGEETQWLLQKELP